VRSLTERCSGRLRGSGAEPMRGVLRLYSFATNCRLTKEFIMGKITTKGIADYSDALEKLLRTRFGRLDRGSALAVSGQGH
jgi:hypothetical protein